MSKILGVRLSPDIINRIEDVRVLLSVHAERTTADAMREVIGRGLADFKREQEEDEAPKPRARIVGRKVVT